MRMDAKLGDAPVKGGVDGALIDPCADDFSFGGGPVRPGARGFDILTVAGVQLLKLGRALEHHQHLAVLGFG